ncbi:SpoIID/LytB domain-containing protein [Peribacillus cavernae]|uniref:SpoIID/LytB domain-containing protein n=1 Tax=Peribacillus cavernae TaxID=1674310 RepID=A0A3S0VXF6_9BACI|nr:SpoIID/LytB domain-containing protein [Peribacillus cavernae]MDQ0217762.1 SpoIID/LytB domain protein [Peribacillus cavernae]RUQ28219.1 SpoIID/LytB domain-containing protein [Peribacillus cavernae]
MKRLQIHMLLAVVLVLIVSVLPEIQAKAAAEPVIRVKLKNYLGNKSEITVKPEVSYTTNLPGLTLEANQTYTLKVSSGDMVVLKGATEVGKAPEIQVEPEKGKGPLSINNRPYLGSFEFIIEDQKYVRPINSINLEDYLKGVVPAEMPALWNQEALKTQAVAARTYALSYSNGTPDDTQYKQVYWGYSWHDNSTRAVEATEGQILTYGGRSIGSGAVFSSSNGGKTESNTNAWDTKQLDYLQIKNDSNDPKTVWNFSIKKKQIDTSKLDMAKADTWWASTMEAEQTMEKLKTWIQANEMAYTDKEIKITAVPELSLKEVGSGGRVKKFSITIEFLTKEQGEAVPHSLETRDISAASLREIIGASVMKSYLVDPVSAASDTLTVSGKGYGHGVGLSQYGANNSAKSGKTYKEILAFYYENTALETAYQLAPEQPVPVEPTPAPVIPAPTPTPIPTPSPAMDATAPTIKETKTSYDSKTNQVKLSFAINENSKVTVQVNDQNGRVITTLVNGADKQAGSQSAVWNVSRVINGKYTFGLTAEDSSHNKSSASVPFTLAKPAPKDTTAPVINNTAASITKDTVSLKYQLNEASKVTIFVKDSKGKTVATLENNAKKDKGIRWASWNTSKAVNGKYTFEITAMDASNNKRTAKVAYTLAKPKPAVKVVKGTVIATTLNIRSTPSTSGRVVGSLKKNQVVTVLTKSSSWYKIQYGKGIGYVHANYLTNVR